MRDFMVEFLKWVKFHGQVMEGVTDFQRLIATQQFLFSVVGCK